MYHKSKSFTREQRFINEVREGESVDEYVRSLFELSEHAQFAEKEETIRDRLVLGLQDQELSQKLQLESDLTLAKAVKIARQHELVKTQIKERTWCCCCCS